MIARTLLAWCLVGGLSVAGCGSSDSSGDDQGDGGDETSGGDATTDATSTDSSLDVADSTTPPDASGDSPADSTSADSSGGDSPPTDTATGSDTTPPTDVGTTFTVKITAPAPDTVVHFVKSDACQGKLFTVAVNAPAGIKKVFWKFITPSAGTGTTCSGAAAYGYPLDLGTTTPLTGTFSENVCVSGLFPGAGGQLWWWCTTPGTAGTAAVGPPLPAVGPPTQGLDRYCWSATKPWQLQVTATDTTGANVTDTLNFFVETP